jgi:hypothetical protein
MKKFNKSLYILLFASAFVFIPYSCTDLTETVYSELDGEKFFENPANISSAVGVAYTNLYWTFGHKYGIGRDAGTDILVVPQRGGDWLDGGEWQRWHKLTITPSDAYVEFWWNLMYKGVSTCNRLIYGLEQFEVPEAKLAISELRAFRAFYYWYLMDMFGNVPLITQFDVPADFKPETSTRKQVFDFIESELKAVVADLPKVTGSKTYSKVNYYVAQMILAKIYLNAEEYSGAPQLDKANAALDEIISSGVYALENDYFVNFSDNPMNSKEIIFGVPMDKVNAQGMEIVLFTLHYALKDKYGLSEGTWNGLSAQESFFNSFEATDKRREGLLFGKQYDANGVQITDPSYEKFNPQNPTYKDPDGAGLNLTPAINMLAPNCLRQAGARIIKWFPAKGTPRYMDNDFAVFRYADALLMKAEVLLRQNKMSEALPFFNQVRTRAGVSAKTTLTLDDILAERGRELYAEGHRRTDLIRFGKFLDARWEKKDPSPATMKLWPIPKTQIDNNPQLKQNDGY